MGLLFADPSLDRVVAAAYDSALDPEGWPALLGLLAQAFNSGFADVFARTQDRTRWHGLAYGLNRDDYQDVFLGTWVKRNVWGERRPVEHAGEVLSTREIMPPHELMRTEMYIDYLAPRGLHEGMRMSLWAGEGWVQDISLLRPWSAGPFDRAEQDLARILLPHLQRAAAITRRLREAEPLARAGLAALDGLRHAAFVLDLQGRPLRLNRRAEALVAEADGLVLRADGLHGADPAWSGALHAMLAQLPGGAGRLRLPRPSGRAPLVLHAVPLGAGNDWSALQAPAVLVLVDAYAAVEPLDPTELAARFGLTQAEADVAVLLAAGQSLSEIAGQRGRSLSTVRTHLSRLMTKTGTQRQAALVRLLLQPDAGGFDLGGPQFG